MKTPWACCCSICCFAQTGPSKKWKRPAAVVAAARLASERRPSGKTGESSSSCLMLQRGGQFSKLQEGNVDVGAGGRDHGKHARFPTGLEMRSWVVMY